MNNCEHTFYPRLRDLPFLILTLIVPFTLSAQWQHPKNDAEILTIISKNKPLKGAPIPADIKDRLGATHVGGKYFLTQEPYLVEGAKKMHELGLGVCKLWFYKQPWGYQYNSTWNLKPDISLKELAQHPYYQQAFQVPFSTIMLSTSAGRINDMLKEDSLGLKNEENEYYELTKYLLETYKDRKLDFILENWEGDWILRGGVGRFAQWGRVEPPADLEDRLLRMKNCFKARQRGVERARNEVKNSKCQVFHAIEVNKVIDAMYGVPTVTTHVLPDVAVDMVSWSAYDATDFDKTGLDLYKGIDFIKKHMKPAPYMKGKKVVFLGEIGIPEMATKNLPLEFKQRWDTYMAVCLAQQIPYMVQWELYCNETVDGVKVEQPNFTKNETDLRGFWLLKPDGTKGYAMQYFDQLLKNAGGKITN